MKSIRRVLLVQPYGIGDLLLVTPVLRALRLIPTVEKVDLLLGSRTEEIVRANPHIDEIFTVDKDRFHRQGRLGTFFDIVRLGRELGRRCYDLLLDYSFQREYAFYGQFFLGIPRRAGFDYKHRALFHTHRLPIPRGFSDRHVVDYFCDLAERAGILVEDRFPEFYLADGAREEACRILDQKGGKSWRRFAAVSPGGGESWGKDAHFKRWPVPFFADLLKSLAERMDWDALLILGSSGERELGEDLRKRMPLATLNLAGEISLTQAAALLEKSALFVANDSGLVHLAHALHVPLIAFYGPVDPATYGPYPPTPGAIAIVKEGLACRPCYRSFRYNDACPHRDCLQALAPEEVFSILESRGFLNNPLMKLC